MGLFLSNIFYSLGIFIVIVNAELFSSVYKLSILAKEEEKLLEALTNYVYAKAQDEEPVSYHIQRLYNDLVPIVSQSLVDPDYSENPINSYHLIGRFVFKWSAVFGNIVECDTCATDIKAVRVNETYQDVASNILWPNEYDVKSAADAILRLRVFYYLDIDDLIDGTVANEKPVLPLTPSQVIQIINLAVEQNMTNEAKLWCEALLRKITYSSHLDENINIVSVIRLLANIYSKAGMPKMAKEILSDVPDSDVIDISKDIETYTKQSSNGTDNEEFPMQWREYDDEYKQLCRENQKSVSELSKLYCYYSNTTIPYFKGKVEVVNLQPQISLFHDVLSDKEINHLRDEGKEMFHRSQVVDAESRAVVDRIRVSQTSWLNDTPGIVQRATDRVAFLTGLETYNCTEPFQIVNYGVGGMYHPHLDALDTLNENDPLREAGNRVATWMFYLNDVKAGGSTVFPNVKARVPVVKGGAAFWYNLLPSGQTDERTLHAGCPVLIGSKWIGNKWIREGGQTFTRPCNLQP